MNAARQVKSQHVIAKGHEPQVIFLRKGGQGWTENIHEAMFFADQSAAQERINQENERMYANGYAARKRTRDNVCGWYTYPLLGY